MSLWDDPNVNWPPILAPPTSTRNRQLLKEVDDEEMERIK